MASKSKKNTDAARLQTSDSLKEKLERLAKEIGALTAADTNSPTTSAAKPRRVPGRFKGALVVGPQFFEPLTDDELKEFAAE
ncbi:hypothetical protein [Agrobacterium sp. DSM 25558]|uniref:hypothetical protein n=1 Tax=Agrobacterium sp. DSM 25558 TaxID=1907665 RepID=UPI00117838CE|nr:hypothetical protein [Agrobacterium sp. DSM 25558]